MVALVQPQQVLGCNQHARIGRRRVCLAIVRLHSLTLVHSLVRKLAHDSDVIVENFRPGTMERWGLGPDDLKQTRPDLIYARVSGYGQDGPYSSRAGYAAVWEAFGGLRHVNGFPGQPPVRANISLGDTLAGIHSALGITMSLLARARGVPGASGVQVVDTAIYESVFNVMEAVVSEYDRKGVVRERSGSTITGIAPTNTYMCRDGKYIVIGANGASNFKRLMVAIEHPEYVRSRLSEVGFNRDIFE